MSEENIEGEIWKPYPEFDFIEGSNFGMVRTVGRYIKTKNGKRWVEGRIFKQRREKNGYMRITTTINGKVVHLSVHRVIASCFLPNPNNLPQVNHIDCDPTNNRVDNLEWCDASYNRQYQEKYGMSSTEARGHELWAINLKTGEKLHFRSRAEAGRELRISRWNIQSVLKGEQNTARGFWFTEDENEVTDKKLQEIKDNMLFLGGIIAVTTERQKPSYFKSQGEAARQLKVNNSHISAVCKGKRKTTHNFWFCRADNHAVENTRAKFGDDVAAKVKALLKENQKII